MSDDFTIEKGLEALGITQVAEAVFGAEPSLEKESPEPPVETGGTAPNDILPSAADLDAAIAAGFIVPKDPAFDVPEEVSEPSEPSEPVDAPTKPPSRTVITPFYTWKNPA